MCGVPALEARMRNCASGLGEYEFPSHNAPVGPPEQLATQLHLKQQALNPSNAASERLIRHRAQCRVCKIEESLDEWPGRHRIKAG
jgi:hypothetical protein